MKTDLTSLESQAGENQRDHQFIFGFIIGFLFAMAVMLFGNLLEQKGSDETPRMKMKPISYAYTWPGIAR